MRLIVFSMFSLIEVITIENLVARITIFLIQSESWIDCRFRNLTGVGLEYRYCDAFHVHLNAQIDCKKIFVLSVTHLTSSNSLTVLLHSRLIEQKKMAPLSDSHPATQALHADDRLNLVHDVAPPIHLSTTFRYSNNPGELVLSEDPVVRTSSWLFQVNFLFS